MMRARRGREAGFVLVLVLAMLVVLGLLFSPAAVQWVTRSRDDVS